MRRTSSRPVTLHSPLLISQWFHPDLELVTKGPENENVLHHTREMLTNDHPKCFWQFISYYKPCTVYLAIYLFLSEVSENENVLHHTREMLMNDHPKCFWQFISHYKPCTVYLAIFFIGSVSKYKIVSQSRYFSSLPVFLSVVAPCCTGTSNQHGSGCKLPVHWSVCPREHPSETHQRFDLCDVSGSWREQGVWITAKTQSGHALVASDLRVSCALWTSRG